MIKVVQLYQNFPSQPARKRKKKHQTHPLSLTHVFFFFLPPLVRCFFPPWLRPLPPPLATVVGPSPRDLRRECAVEPPPRLLLLSPRISGEQNLNRHLLSSFSGEPLAVLKYRHHQWTPLAVRSKTHQTIS